jgi:hypothetical protein
MENLSLQLTPIPASIVESMAKGQNTTGPKS